MTELTRLAELLKARSPIVFLGGAGVSTESGIPDFRSESGVYKTVKEYGVPPETILSAGFFWNETETFYDYYRKYMLFPDAQPNGAHRSLARLEQAGRLSGVVTQNIDGLHQKAGSQKVLELHGSVHRNTCTQCGKHFSLSYMLKTEGVPRCDACGASSKPDVVLYGEGLDEVVPARLGQAASPRPNCSSWGAPRFSVYPAAGLINYFRGRELVVINKSATPADDSADHRSARAHWARCFRRLQKRGCKLPMYSGGWPNGQPPLFCCFSFLLALPCRAAYCPRSEQACCAAALPYTPQDNSDVPQP